MVMSLEPLEQLYIALQLCRSALGHGVGIKLDFIKVGIWQGEYDEKERSGGVGKENTGGQGSDPGAICRILAG